MKELQIIVKTPDDGEPDAKRVTVGYKFMHTDGLWYGDWVKACANCISEGTVLQAIQLLVKTAYQAERRLLEIQKAGRESRD